MTDVVARLRQLEAQATPAPWTYDTDTQCFNFADNDENLALSLAARNALPQLLDIAEAARWHYGIHQADTACDVCDAWLAFAALDSQETE